MLSLIKTCIIHFFVCPLKSEDIGAICWNCEPAEGSAPADHPDAHMCCTLQPSKGTTHACNKNMEVSLCVEFGGGDLFLIKITPVAKHTFFLTCKVVIDQEKHTVSFSAPRWCKGLSGSRRCAFPIAVTSVGGPGEHQSSYALSGCRRSGPAGSGGGRPWLQCLCLAALLWQVESSSSTAHVTFYFCLFSLFYFCLKLNFD